MEQGKVYDVTGNPSYAPGKAYHGKFSDDSKLHVATAPPS